MYVDGAAFNRNANKVPLEEIARYAGQWVAWKPDGTAIVASSPVSPEDVVEQLKQAGHDPSQFVHDYIPRLDEVFIGGMSTF